MLLIPTDAGLMLPCGMFHSLQCVNDESFGDPADPTQSALNNAGTRAVACFPGDCQWCELQD